jgi:hypothetical protein
MTDKLKIAGLALALTFSTAAVAADCCKDMACCREGADCCKESKGKQDDYAEHAGDDVAHV